MSSSFDFAFDEPFRPLLMAAGVTPASAHAEVGRNHMRVRFGLWVVTTRLSNVKEMTITGPYKWYRAIGTRLSLADRGLTFGTNAQAGVCVSFHEPVRGIDPFGLIRHPSLTLTLADLGGFMNAVEEQASPVAV